MFHQAYKVVLLALAGVSACLPEALGGDKPIGSAPDVAAPAPGTVKLAEDSQAVVLANRELSVTFAKRGGQINSIIYHGRELLGNGGKGYVQITEDRTNRASLEYRLHRRESNLVDIAFVNTNPRYPFDLETHYVLRADEPGVHNYMVFGHDAARHPGVFGIGQLNLCVRVDPKIFTHAAVDDGRIRAMPSPEAMKAGEQVMDATIRLADGNVYSKYFYSAAMDDTHTVHGVMGEGIGIWIVMPSHEHLNGGPEHQELTVHQTDTTPVLLRHYVAGHYGAGGIRSDSNQGSWSRASATWFIYVNTGKDRAELWRDAKDRARKEADAWPYKWLDDARFQLNRGTVSGRLAFDDGKPADQARIILADHEENPSPLAWQQQWRGYRFIGRTGLEGRFTIPKVRGGLYDLYAWRTGTLGFFVKRGVRVGAGETVNVGDMVWSLPPGRELLWQIGVPDRSAAEFGFAEDFRQWGLWDKIAQALPDGVTFTVGKSKDRDLPFQLAVTQNKDLSWRLPVWRIQFDNRAKRTGKAVLTLALAESESNISRGGPRMRISLNGEEIVQVQDLAQDAAAHRSGAYGLYQEREITLDAGKMKEGANTLTLELLPPGRAVDRPLGYPGAAVMLDCLRLEVGK